MGPGKTFGNRVAVVWELARALRQRQAFHAAGGLVGTTVYDRAGGFPAPSAQSGLSKSHIAQFVRDQPDFVVWTHSVPLGWHAAAGPWRFPARKGETPLMARHRALCVALLQVGRVLDQQDGHP